MFLFYGVVFVTSEIVVSGHNVIQASACLVLHKNVIFLLTLKKVVLSILNKFLHTIPYDSKIQVI